MAIIHFTHDHDAESYPDGAMCDWPRRSTYESHDGKALITWKTHVGLCLREREMNGYDDSDFYMLVWNEDEGKAEEILFASTRGWSYPSYGSSVDATPDVVAKYEAWQAAQDRCRKITGKLRLRNERRAIARQCGLESYHEANRLAAAVGGGETFDAVVRLLKTKNFRSDFRRSLADQIRAWLADPEPKYSRPLSPRQLQYLR